MPRPMSVMAEPFRMVSGSGVSDAREVAQMEMPTACTLQGRQGSKAMEQEGQAGWRLEGGCVHAQACRLLLLG